MKHIKHATLALLTLSIATTFANFTTYTNAYAEPTNLAVKIAELKKYHDSGQYQKEIQSVINDATHYVSHRVKKNSQSAHPRKLAIVFDIDETTLSNYSDMEKMKYGGTLKIIMHDIDKGHDPAIQASLDLYNYARHLDVAVFFITGRREYERQITINNLHLVGYYDWQGLILKPDNLHVSSPSIFKTAERKKIVDNGYDIIASVGDQYSDLTGGYVDKGFKLPNPYYYLP